ncbi:DUF214 family protein [Pelomyxa schiedti]|nr:DUF214 family protein [Pelomyxa schiedti]
MDDGAGIELDEVPAATRRREPERVGVPGVRGRVEALMGGRGVRELVSMGLKWMASTALLWLHFCKQTWVQIKTNKANYTIGFLACFVVVTVVAILLSVVTNAPVIYLRLSELQDGEKDVVLEINTDTGYTLLNFSMARSVLATDEGFNYTTPRWELSGRIVHSNSCPPGLDLADPYWKYHGVETDPSIGYCEDPDTCLQTICPGTLESNDLLVIDSDREHEILLGRAWDLPKLERGNCYLKSTLARSLHAQVGDVMLVGVTVTQTGLISLMNAVMHGSYTTLNSTVAWMPFTVAAIYDKPKGKHAAQSDIALIVEYEYFISYLGQQMDPWDEELRNYITQVDLYQHARSMVVNLPPPRVSAYMSSNVDVVQSRVIKFASEVAYRAGFNNIDVSLPVLDSIINFSFVTLFLGLLINISIVILLFLSVILIYSLLMINVETRTFEMGVMRTLGTSKLGVIGLMITQAMAYALPSWILGMCFAQLVEVFIAKAFEALTAVPLSKLLSPNAVGIATLLGFLIPILSSILPIRTALTQELQESLDTRRSKTQAVQITMERAEPGKINWTLILVGMVLTVFGFGIYYVLPSSLLANNFQVMLNMFFLLIMSMLLGLVLLSLSLETLLEKIFCWLFFFWDHTAIVHILMKNLIAHKLRNRKTTIMYSVSLSFIIFIFVAYNMQVSSFQYSLLQDAGAPVVVYARGSSNLLPLAQSLEGAAAADPRIQGYTWKTRNLAEITGMGLGVSNLGHIYSASNTIYGLSPNFFNVSLPSFLKVSEQLYDPSVPSNAIPSERVYTLDGSRSTVLGSTYKKYLGVKPGDHFLMTFSDNAPLITKVAQFLDSAPSFVFSKFPSTTDQDTFISFPSYLRMSNGGIPSMKQLPLREFLIKVKPDTPYSQFDDIIDGLWSAAVSTPNTVPPSIWDFRDEMEPFVVAAQIMTLFFLFMTAIAMTTSFFSLISSMFANIYEQTKEIGVLRAVGLSKSWLSRVYIYEAFIVVFSSSFFGLLIGTAVGWTMTLQQLLFTQLPIPFIFPWQILLVVFVLSVVFALLSALGPVRRVISRPVVHILRMLT